MWWHVPCQHLLTIKGNIIVETFKNYLQQSNFVQRGSEHLRELFCQFCVCVFFGAHMICNGRKKHTSEGVNTEASQQYTDNEIK